MTKAHGDAEPDPPAHRRPIRFLSARWSNLILATYAVDPAALAPRLPPGCRLDLTADGHALASLVAFDFQQCRVLGVPWPGFVNFPEVNLRFYVRHGQDNTERRGVVFVREFVPQRTVAALARWTYNEPYAAVPTMRSHVDATPDTLTVAHDLPVAGRACRIAVTADATNYCPADDSPEAFLIEHQWGFGTSRLLRRRVEYQVVHEPWAVHRVRRFDLRWDWAAAYGREFADLQSARPLSVVLAAGSAVSVYPRGDVDPHRKPRPPVPAPPSVTADHPSTEDPS